MLEDVRRGVRGMVEAGMGALSGALTPSRARELAKSLSQGQGVEQINRVAQDLLDWSQRSREWISDAVQREVKRQLQAAGIATREDLDALRKRVRELEKGSKPKAAGSAGRAKKSSPSRTKTAATSPSPSAAGEGPETSAGVGDPSPPTQ